MIQINTDLIKSIDSAMVEKKSVYLLLADAVVAHTEPVGETILISAGVRSVH